MIRRVMTAEVGGPAEAFCRALGRQLGHPTGPMGRLLGHLMGYVNATPNIHALEALDLKPHDRVLEVGFGPGIALAEVLRRSGGPHAGIDASAEMVELATRRNHQAIRSGRLDLVCGEARELPWPDGTFDKALLVNVLYFSDEDGRDLAQVRRVLRPGGVLVAYVTDDDTMRRWPFTPRDSWTGRTSTRSRGNPAPTRLDLRVDALKSR